MLNSKMDDAIMDEEHLKILLVEDNPGDVYLIKELLKTSGLRFVIERSSSLAEAIKMIDSQDFDAVLLDLGLPDSFGLETLRKLQPAKNNAAIVVLTGLDDEEIAISTVKEGAQDYLIKSNLTVDNIIRAIRYGIERMKLYRELAVAKEELQKLNEELDHKVKTRTRELEIYAAELKELNATKDKFFGIIAHDLKNPLSSLIGASELLINYVNQLDKDNILNISMLLHGSAQQGYALLENLLEWSMTQTGKLEFSPRKMIVNEIIKDTISIFKTQATNKNVDLQCKINGILEAEIDKNLIGSVLRNLISNAIKFTPKDGKVFINAYKVQENIEISVKDTGIGIPEDIGNNIFRIDVKYTREGTEQEKGTGLGLLLCKEFIEKHGGRIWVGSKLGEGSEFKFTIPLKSPVLN
jgi:signal transduction histidine kinase